ncbi:MAG: hypothetical protein J7619_07540 [Dyadobacter sp.]|uniref:hypothetical protein n=1 Tax=Dyadobacter sp. TaxID=1914288 RepID=UPI001B1FFA2D|nr:hypothetical protein [Dyadobacter sp.]MBO9612530.1 hypothetical protein [Dyadobacter sp.]
MSEAALLQKSFENIKLYKKHCDSLREADEGIPGKQKFHPGQVAYYVETKDTVQSCTVDRYQGSEILVSKDGKPFGWFSDDTLFHTASEAYSSSQL